jgi:hypothetical protein
MSSSQNVPAFNRVPTKGTDPRRKRKNLSKDDSSSFLLEMPVLCLDGSIEMYIRPGEPYNV